MKAQAKGHLPLSTSLTSSATKTAIFPQLQHSLISLGQLCDDDCQVLLDKTNLFAIKDNKIILQGRRSKTGDGLWDIPLQTSIKKPTQAPSYQPSMNVIIRKNEPAKQLVKYLHACCFYPTIPTFIKAIKNNHFLSWPGLTVKLVKKYLDPSVTTAKGHLRQEQQGLQSTHADSTLTVNQKVTEEEDTSPTIN